MDVRYCTMLPTEICRILSIHYISENTNEFVNSVSVLLTSVFFAVNYTVKDTSESLITKLLSSNITN